MMEVLKAMDIEKLKMIAGIVLAVVGAIAMGLPVMLHAILLVLKAIPGDQGEARVEAAAAMAEKIRDKVLSVYPKAAENK